MAYQLTEDIDVTKKFNKDDLDKAMKLCLNRISSAFSKLDNHPNTFGSLMESVFQSFGRTHKSILLLLKHAEEDPNFASDAMSLVREQIEKIYIVALILDDPAKWASIYFKDDWKRLYKYKVLLNIEERKNLPRWQDGNSEEEETYERMRLVAKISEAEKEFIVHKYKKPGATKPSHLKGVVVPIFPTPKGVIDNIIDAKLKEFLERWHKEYEFICGFSHVGLGKSFVSSLLQASEKSEADKRTAINSEVVIPTVVLSYLAMASACTIAWKYLIKHDSRVENSVEFLDSIMKFWDEMTQLSLLGKALWDIYAKDALPPKVESFG